MNKNVLIADPEDEVPTIAVSLQVSFDDFEEYGNHYQAPLYDPFDLEAVLITNINLRSSLSIQRHWSIHPTDSFKESSMLASIVNLCRLDSGRSGRRYSNKISKMRFAQEAFNGETSKQTDVNQASIYSNHVIFYFSSNIYIYGGTALMFRGHN